MQSDIHFGTSDIFFGTSDTQFGTSDFVSGTSDLSFGITYNQNNSLVVKTGRPFCLSES